MRGVQSRRTTVVVGSRAPTRLTRNPKTAPHTQRSAGPNVKHASVPFPQNIDQRVLIALHDAPFGGTIQAILLYFYPCISQSPRPAFGRKATLAERHRPSVDAILPDSSDMSRISSLELLTLRRSEFTGSEPVRCRSTPPGPRAVGRHHRAAHQHRRSGDRHDVALAGDGHGHLPGALGASCRSSAIRS